MKHKQIGLKKNMLLYAIRGVSSVAFPLITHPYIARVLGAEQIGKSDFSKSIISYFLLIAGLGINTYAIREGAKMRSDKGRTERFLSEVYSISFISTIVSYLLLLLTIVVFGGLRSYIPLIIIYSIQMIFVTLGLEWIYSIYEDYLYITIRTVAFQLLSLVLLFTLVKQKEDLIVYVWIQVITASASYVTNRIYSGKYVRIHLTHNNKWREHIKPILVLFAMSATVTVYVSSDITMLGILCGDKTVGIYSVAVHIYSVIKVLVSSVIVVAIPKIASLLGEQKLQEVNQTATEVYSLLITLLMPVIVGIIVMREQIVFVISSREFSSAVNPLTLLAVAMFFCMGAWFWGQCVLVPFGKENMVLKITIISAAANIILNAFLIPLWNENAAALTTAISEAISFTLCRMGGMRHVTVAGVGMIAVKSVIGCVAIVLIGTGVNTWLFTAWTQLLVAVMMSAISYFSIELLLRNDVVVDLVHSVERRSKTVT